MAWLDNVRVWLTVLVLAHHAALTYWAGVRGVRAASRSPSAKATVLLALGIVACWAAAWLLRRIPGARRVF